LALLVASADRDSTDMVIALDGNNGDTLLEVPKTDLGADDFDVF